MRGWLRRSIPSLADSLGGGIGLGNRLTFGLCRELLDDTVDRHRRTGYGDCGLCP